MFLAATKQLYEWFSPSACLSVRLSHLFDYVPIVVSSCYYPWRKRRPCKRSWSKVKVTEVNTQLSRFRTVTPVWIHIWWWNEAQSLMLLRRGVLLFFKVIRQISRSHRFRPKLGVSGLLLQFEFTNGYKMMLNAWSSIEEVPYCFQGHLLNFKVTREKNIDFDPNLAFPDCNSSLNSLMAMKWCTKLEAT